MQISPMVKFYIYTLEIMKPMSPGLQKDILVPCAPFLVYKVAKLNELNFEAGCVFMQCMMHFLAQIVYGFRNVEQMCSRSLRAPHTPKS